MKVGGRYTLPPGEIMVTKVFEVSLADVTPELARRSGFVGNGGTRLHRIKPPKTGDSLADLGRVDEGA